MNKKMFARGGKKINLVLIFGIMTYLVLAVPSSQAATNPNYGTTTFFSQKAEQPSDKPPVYDVGLRSGDENNGKDNNKNDNGDATAPDSGLFNSIITGIGSLFGDNSVSNDTAEKSLFDWQANSDQDSNDGSSTGEFIMGARGESYENMSAEEIEDYNNRISQKFEFNNSSGQAAPKKSKLLFTNIVLPVDMTTQYVIIILVILVAIGAVTGYYFWKKEMDRVERKSKE